MQPCPNPLTTTARGFAQRPEVLRTAGCHSSDAGAVRSASPTADRLKLQTPTSSSSLSADISISALPSTALSSALIAMYLYPPFRQAAVPAVALKTVSFYDETW